MGKGKKSAKSKSAGRRAVPAVHAALVPDTTAIAQDTTRLSEGATVQVTVESKDELESLKAATITTGQAVVQDAPTLETVVPFCPPPCGGPAVPLEQLMGSTTSTPTSDDVMLSEADWAEIEATMLGRVERRLSGQAVLPLPEAWLQEAEDHLLNQLSPTKERNCDYLDTPMTPGPPPELPQGLLRPVPESDENMNEEEMFRQLEADLVLRLAKGETPRDWLSDSLDEHELWQEVAQYVACKYQITQPPALPDNSKDSTQVAGIAAAGSAPQAAAVPPVASKEDGQASESMTTSVVNTGPNLEVETAATRTGRDQVQQRVVEELRAEVAALESANQLQETHRQRQTQAHKSKVQQLEAETETAHVELQLAQQVAHDLRAMLRAERLSKADREQVSQAQAGVAQGLQVALDSEVAAHTATQDVLTDAQHQLQALQNKWDELVADVEVHKVRSTQAVADKLHLEQTVFRHKKSLEQQTLVVEKLTTQLTTALQTAEEQTSLAVIAQDEKQVLQSQVTAANARLEEICAINDSMLARITTTQQEFQADLAKVEQQLEVRVCELALQEQALQRLTAERDHAHHQTRRAQDLLTGTQEQALETTRDLKTRLQAAEAQTQSLIALRQQDEAQLSAVQLQLAEANSRLEESQACANEREQAGAANLDAVKAQLQGVQHERHQLSNQVTDQESRIQLLEGDLASYQSRVAEFMGANPNDPRSEIVRLRLQIYNHTGELERQQAKELDLRSQLHALQEALRLTQSRAMASDHKLTDIASLHSKLSIAENMSKLWEDENRTLRSRVATEVSGRTKAETESASLQIDLKHMRTQLEELQGSIAVLRQQQEQQTFASSLSLRGGPSTNDFGGSSYGQTVYPTTTLPPRSGSLKGGYFDALFNPSPMPSWAGPLPGSSTGAGTSPLSSLDHMRDARLAMDRAKTAEKREAILQRTVKELEAQLESLRLRGSDRSNNVPMDVHTHLLRISDERAAAAERECRRLESELSRVERELKIVLASRDYNAATHVAYAVAAKHCSPDGAVVGVPAASVCTSSSKSASLLLGLEQSEQSSAPAVALRAGHTHAKRPVSPPLSPALVRRSPAKATAPIAAKTPEHEPQIAKATPQRLKSGFLRQFDRGIPVGGGVPGGSPGDVLRAVRQQRQQSSSSPTSSPMSHAGLPPPKRTISQTDDDDAQDNEAWSSSDNEAETLSPPQPQAVAGIVREPSPILVAHASPAPTKKAGPPLVKPKPNLKPKTVLPSKEGAIMPSPLGVVVVDDELLGGRVQRAPSLTGQFSRPQIQKKRLPSRRGRSLEESSEAGQPQVLRIAERDGTDTALCEPGASGVTSHEESAAPGEQRKPPLAEMSVTGPSESNEDSDSLFFDARPSSKKKAKQLLFLDGEDSDDCDA